MQSAPGAGCPYPRRRVPAIAWAGQATDRDKPVQLTQPAAVQLRVAKRGRHGHATRLRTRVRVLAPPGTDRPRFAGRLTRGKRLRPGRYRVTAIATTPAGARTRPVSARSTVVAP